MAKMDFNMNTLVSNIVHKNQYSHCRLCLTEVKDQNQFLRFDDSVCIDEDNINFQLLQEIINTIFFEDKFTKDIPGADAVCVPCVNKAVQCYRFIKQCQTSSETLTRVFDNILTALNDTEDIDIDPIERDKNLYLTICKNNYKCALVIKDKEKNLTPNKRRNPKNHSQSMCLLCYVDFGSIMSLKAHNAACHYISTCMICFETFIDESELSDHIRTNHKFQCEQCDVVKSTAEHLQTHIRRAHIDFDCSVCGKTFRGLDNLQIHRERHPDNAECPKCGKSYATKCFYMKHVKKCLKDQLDPLRKPGSVVKTFVCDKCEKSYSTVSALRVHKRFMHAKDKQYECNYCGKKFTAVNLLKIHLAAHTNERNFKVNIRNNKFDSKKAVLYHTHNTRRHRKV